MDTEIYDSVRADTLDIGDMIRYEGHDYIVGGREDDFDAILLTVEPLDGVEDEEEIPFGPFDMVPLVRYA